VNPELEQLLILQDRQQKIRQIQAEIKILPQQKANLERMDRERGGRGALKQQGRQPRSRPQNLELDVGTRATASPSCAPANETRRTTIRGHGHTKLTLSKKKSARSQMKELELMEAGRKIKAELVGKRKRAER